MGIRLKPPKKTWGLFWFMKLQVVCFIGILAQFTPGYYADFRG